MTWYCASNTTRLASCRFWQQTLRQYLYRSPHMSSCSCNVGKSYCWIIYSACEFCRIPDLSARRGVYVRGGAVWACLVDTNGHRVVYRASVRPPQSCAASHVVAECLHVMLLRNYLRVSNMHNNIHHISVLVLQICDRAYLLSTATNDFASIAKYFRVYSLVPMYPVHAFIYG